jgi:threonyl-tRNA synthetase
MIHRAPFGSMERFIGLLIEHFGGAFPTWLAPEQVRVLAISEKSNAYADTVLQSLLDRGIRAKADKGDERIQAKIRDASDMKLPWMLIVGPKDAAENNVSVRMLGIRDDLGAVGLDVFVNAIEKEIETRGAQSALKACFPDVEFQNDA